MAPFISEKTKLFYQILVNQTSEKSEASIYGNICMKKNNKFRSNNNYNNNNNYNPIYSLNYKFDSSSPAGKCSGTALDLIKRYNELAKEAQGNSDYVGAEVFRQYAEHYRKIVTDINEKKNQRLAAQARENETAEKNQLENSPEIDHNDSKSGDAVPAVQADSAETLEKTQKLSVTPIEEAPAAPAKREFKVIEISAAETKVPAAESKTPKAPRSPRRKSSEAVVAG